VTDLPGPSRVATDAGFKLLDCWDRMREDHGVRSRSGYWIGGGLIVAGIAGAVLWFVTSLMALDDKVDDFQRAPLPGTATVQLEGRKYVIYYEGPNAESSVPPFEIGVTDARTGQPIDIATYGGSLTYSMSGHEGSAQATITPARAGEYVVRTETDARVTGSNVALGSSIAGQILRTILGAFAIGGLLLVGGGTLIAVTAIRRSRAGRGSS
jgi:hypothetical protein